MKRQQPKTDCIILGGGLQGASVALALASEGVSSTIIEARAELMNGASLINEGKIHLGFVYAMENGRSTRELMLRGALSFAPLLDQWCGPLPWDAMVSDPFDYAVMSDSLLSAAEVERSYQELEGLLEDLSLPRDHYLGRPLDRLFMAGDSKAQHPSFDQPEQQMFTTAERSVDPRLLAERVRESLRQEPLIEVRCNTRIVDVRLEEDEVALLCMEGSQRTNWLRTSRAINCTWESREALDRKAGLPAQKLNYRVKHQILIQPPQSAQLPSPTTMVQGPYGDIVPWPDGKVYLSWYPVGRSYFGASPPQELTSDEQRQTIAQETLETFCHFFPSLQGSHVVSCKAGIIVARGSSDVDAPESGLHARHQVGVRRHGAWTSVDPGKLTTAPYMASRLVAELLDSAPSR